MITPEELTQQGLAIITFTNLVIVPWGRSNGQFVSYGLSATADTATLIPRKQGYHYTKLTILWVLGGWDETAGQRPQSRFCPLRPPNTL